VERVLLIARHGETAWSAEGRLQSRTDLPLSAEGEAQARALGDALATVPLAAIRTSPSVRAVRTAEIVAAAQARAPAPVVDDRLREVDLGPFEGQTPAELRGGPLARAFEEWRGDPPVFAPGMEPYDLGAARVGDVISAFRATEGITLLVTHAYLARLAVASLIGLPLANVRRLRLDYGRLAVVRWEGELPRLAGLNLGSFWLSPLP
jgi:probable phosphoglycerate mutase